MLDRSNATPSLYWALSGKHVGEQAVNYPGFVLRTDLCFKWLVYALIQGLENRSEATGNDGNIDVSSFKESFH